MPTRPVTNARWESETEMTYKIVRFFQKHDREIITRGLTLEQAQAHCEDTETSSRTATSEAAVERTRIKGAWFDGYEEE
jgi:hypothetical protein